MFLDLRVKIWQSIYQQKKLESFQTLEWGFWWLSGYGKTDFWWWVDWSIKQHLKWQHAWPMQILDYTISYGLSSTLSIMSPTWCSWLRINSTIHLVSQRFPSEIDHLSVSFWSWDCAVKAVSSTIMGNFCVGSFHSDHISVLLISQDKFAIWFSNGFTVT
jgi:hypothetical protein